MVKHGKHEEAIMALNRHSLKAPEEIEWLTDNGSGYIAEPTRTFAAELD
jgi:transposase InsO family protein